MIIAAKNNLSLLKIAFKGWWSKDPFRESAVIAYYSISSMIVFYGAEFTHAYANMYSGKVPPTEIAKTEIQATLKNKNDQRAKKRK